MRLRTLSHVWVLSVLLLGPLQTALAQGSPSATQNSAAARDAFRRGEAAYSAGNYEQAVREWINAYSADPRPRIQFNLSQAYERMGELQNAIDALKRFLESADPEDDNYSDANARLVALQQRLASTGVVVQGGAEGGSILVDDKDWGRTPRPDKITVPPGSHVVTVRWPSGQEFRTNVYVPAGQVVELNIPDEAGAGSAAPTPAATAAAAQPSTTPSSGTSAAPDRRVLWYSLGGGVAAAGVGLIVYGVVRGAATSKCGERDSQGLRTYCDPDGKDSAETQSIVGYVSGGALVLGGAALFVVGALSHRRADARAGSSCGVGYASASCTVRF